MMKLRIGERGDIIKDLQVTLKNLGYDPGPVNGIYSNETKLAVLEFQKSNNLTDDGLIGHETMKALGFKEEPHTPTLERKTFSKNYLPPKGTKSYMHHYERPHTGKFTQSWYTKEK